MFTPFAFFQNAVVAGAAPASFTGYYFGGSFTTYATSTNPYFRVLNSTGSFSSSFNQGAGFGDAIYTLATQSDGKIIAGGNFTTYSGSSNISRIVRLNTNGTRDTTFNPGTTGANSVIYSVAVQSDGKIILGGAFTTYSGSNTYRLARANTDGTKDLNFNMGALVSINSTVNAVAVQADQKIVIVGAFTTYSGSTKNYIARINSDGTADTGSSWNQGTGFSLTANSVALQSDGKILVGGAFTTYSGSTSTRIARLNTSGTFDASFNTGAGFNSTVNTLAVQSDGKVIAGGFFTTYSGSTVNYFTRLNVSGTIDTSFNTGTGFDGTVTNTYIQSDGKILVQGAFSNYSGSVALGIVRLNTDGTRDTTFNLTQSINNSTQGANSTIQLSNGSILLGGIYTGNKVGYATFQNSSGNTTAQSIIGSYGLTTYVNAMISQSDGKIVLGGGFINYSGSTKNYIVRINTDGTADTGSAWNTGVGFGNIVNCLATQSDGKILVGGAFTTYSGSSNISRIVRLNTNGTRDTTFNPGTAGASSNVLGIAVQSDGKIVLGGGFINYSGSTKNYIARANTDGTADTGSAWNTGVGFGNQINAIALQSDGKIIAGGIFSTYSGSTKNNIARLNTDGTADTGSSWNQGTAFNASVTVLTLQSDGKILAGGAFTAYSGSSNITRIARLNTNGTLDTTFNPGTTGANGTVSSIAIEPGTGKIMIGGSFTSYSGSTANGIVRVNTNGTLDTTFTPTGSGFNANVQVILPY